MPLIEIRSRLRPFSHTPGIRMLVPGTELVVQAFPTLIKVGDKQHLLEVSAPVENFTVVQDLERGCVTVFSRSYMVHVLPSGEIREGKHAGTEPYTGPRYSFGSHKKQQWERIKERGEIEEIFPVWHRLGSLLTLPEAKHDDLGTFKLLADCKEAISSHHPERVAPAFKALFHAGFEQLMVPRSADTDHQGYLPYDAPISSVNPLYLLTEGAQLIRSLFLRFEGDELALLPDLPPELHAGRITGETCGFGKLSLQWQSKRLRIVHLHATESGELHLHLPPDIRQFRIRETTQKRGTNCERGTALAISASRQYVLDCFNR